MNLMTASQEVIHVWHWEPTEKKGMASQTQTPGGDRVKAI